jgi:hypothetical protein
MAEAEQRADQESHTAGLSYEEARRRRELAKQNADAAREAELEAAEAEERARREGRYAGFHDEQAAERERQTD